MNHFKKYLAVLLALVLMLSAFSGCGKKAAPAATEAAPAETVAATEAAVVAETEAPAEQDVSESHYHVGDKIDDFTITTYDGKEVNLYKLLEEKDMVLLNLWATYCGPCAAEFPAMREAYEQYQDKVGIIALSGFAADTDEILAEYAQEKGMTFHVGRDTVGLAQRVHSPTIPTSVVVDRFGVICVIASGGEPEASVFTNVFDMYTAEDYTESIFMPKLSSVLPDAQPSDPAQLNAALNVEGGNLAFTNPVERFYWPMVVEEKDGRTVVSAANADSPQSAAVLDTQVEAKAGDVLVMEYKLSSENNLSILRMTVDGRDVKVTSMNQDWGTISYVFEGSGTHQISVRFERDFNENEGKEGLWIDSIRLVSGDEAAEFLAKKQQYPVGKELGLDLLNENMEMIAFVRKDTGEMIIDGAICSDPVLRYEAKLLETMDPECAFLTDTHNNVYPLTSFINGDSYLIEVPNTALTDANYSIVYLHANAVQWYYGFVFTSWEQAEAYSPDFKVVRLDEVTAQPEAPAGDGTYTVTYVDQNGDPVPGVMCQVCDANTCQVFVSNAEGVCEFKLPAGFYEIHTLKVPAGYEGDTTTITEAPMGGGELNFTLTKN